MAIYNPRPLLVRALLLRRMLFRLRLGIGPAGARARSPTRPRAGTRAGSGTECHHPTLTACLERYPRRHFCCRGQGGLIDPSFHPVHIKNPDALPQGLRALVTLQTG